MKTWFFPILSIIFIFASCQEKENSNRLVVGQKINESITLQADTFFLPGNEKEAALYIEGENIVVDFNGAVLVGSKDLAQPDLFTGTAIKVSGKNITVKNAHIHGYKIALSANEVDSLKILDCDLSYNYRQKLKSTRAAEHLDDWLYYHHNENDEWLRYGAAAYLKDCDHALVRGIKVTGGQNGLMLVGCDNGLFYNNSIQFNSGIGIGLYRSSQNRIMHNRLDWNVRGYSHGIYARGQDSAGILVYEQSDGNTFAYNSATHSGDGFFLWAGQTTMDSGEGGCNDNLIFHNDFSYAPTNGIEVTFSRNVAIGNKLHGCKYGIWGGYSFESKFLSNDIQDCKFGIAIEHGQDNIIAGNTFKEDTVAIKIFERGKQPEDWGYSKAKDVASQNYLIRSNNFFENATALNIVSSENVRICSDNEFIPSNQLAKDREKKLFDSSKSISDCSDELSAEDILSDLFTPPLSDAQPHSLDSTQLKGRQYILVDEWGPYNFEYPSIWLRNIEGNEYTFLLYGPPTGNYKIIDGEGWGKLNRVTGAFPATLIATAKPDAQKLSLELEFIGQEFIDQFGRVNKKGKVFPFRWEEVRSEK